METILLTGKTSLFPEEILQYIAETCSVFVTGKRAGSGSGNTKGGIHYFSVHPSESEFHKVFEAGQVRAVWHVSSCADGGKPADERQELDTLVQLCARYRVPRLIVLTEGTDPTGYRELLEQCKNGRRKGRAVETAVVRLPLLTGTGTPRGRLRRIFTAMQKGRGIAFYGNADRSLCVLSMQELTAMLLRMSTETWFRPGIYAADSNRGRMEELRELLLTIRPDAQISFIGEEDREERLQGSRRPVHFRIPLTEVEAAVCDGQLGEMYRLPVSSDWRSGITAQYAAMSEEEQTVSGMAEKAAEFLRKSRTVAGAVLDLAVMFALTEYLARITSESVYFKIVDVRLLFIILMGSMHGLTIGFAASFLECVLLVAHYRQIGISGILLFYNVENWIPFVYYITAGVISGYTHRKNLQKIRSTEAENDLIRRKYLFLNEAFRTCADDKEELREQILSEKESYEKLYGAVRQMSQRTPEAVCVEAVGVLRRLLENDTVSIYQLEEAGRKAELLSCCMENAGRMVLDTEACRQMMQVILEGDTWKNTALAEDVPMYASMVHYSRAMGKNGGAEKHFELIVTIEKAGQDQLSQWYVNHFSILCGLLQDALERASMRERIRV